MTFPYRQRPDSKLVIPTIHTMEIIDIDEIVYIMAYESYVKMFLKNERNITCTKSFGEVWSMLSDFDFFQSHKSYALNLKHIERYHRAGEIETKCDYRIPLARRRKDEFFYVIREYFGASGVGIVK